MSAPPDPKALRRRAVIGFAVFGVWWGAWGTTLPAIQRNAGVDDGQLGIALLCIAVGAMAAMRVVGTMIDRFGGRVLPAALASFGFVGVLPALVRGVVGLALTLLVVGALSGAIDVAINGVAARYEHLTGDSVMNLAHGSFSVAVLLTSPVVGAFRDTGTGPIMIFTVVAVVLAVAATATVDRFPDAARSATRSGSPWPWWRPPRALLVLGGLVGLAYVVESAWQNWAAILLERTLEARPGVAALGPAVFALTAALGRFVGQPLVRRMDETRLLTTAATVAASGTLVAAMAPSVVWALAGIALAGAGTSVCAPTLLGRAARLVPAERHGAAIGTVTTLGYLGFGVAPALVGLVSRVTSLRVALACVSGLALLLAIGSRRPRGV